MPPCIFRPSDGSEDLITALLQTSLGWNVNGEFKSNEKKIGTKVKKRNQNKR